MSRTWQRRIFATSDIHGTWIGRGTFDPLGKNDNDRWRKRHFQAIFSARR